MLDTSQAKSGSHRFRFSITSNAATPMLPVAPSTATRLTGRLVDRKSGTESAEMDSAGTVGSVSEEMGWGDVTGMIVQGVRGRIMGERTCQNNPNKSPRPVAKPDFHTVR